MRFVMLVRADANMEAGALPTEQELAEMGQFNEELVEAEDFGEAFTPELRAQEERLRARVEARLAPGREAAAP